MPHETITRSDQNDREQAIVVEVWVGPQPVRWDLPVVALISGDAVSSGDGGQGLLRSRVRTVLHDEGDALDSAAGAES